MREILFRGKRKDNDEWIYGSLQCFKGYSIFENAWKSWFAVRHETICQYIGMDDINKKKIFEHDIVKFHRVNALGYTTERIGEVLYYDDLPVFYIMATTGDAWDWCECEDVEVIGNNIDNQELLHSAYDN